MGNDVPTLRESLTGFREEIQIALDNQVYLAAVFHQGARIETLAERELEPIVCVCAFFLALVCQGISRVEW